KKDATSSVHTQNIDGHRYLMIDLEDPNIEVNGLAVQIAETNLPQTEETLLECLEENKTAEADTATEKAVSEPPTSDAETEIPPSSPQTGTIPDENLPSEEDFLQAADITDNIPTDSAPF
ncbi:MAG: hypothetical protein Q4D37_08760, partial [Oscillospiraceae bacterium]|nr:hypothetical protein [Oscillospiraceae bacterium]